ISVCILLQQESRMRATEVLLKSPDLYRPKLRMRKLFPVDKSISKSQQFVHLELFVLTASSAGLLVKIQVGDHQLVGIGKDPTVTIEPIQFAAEYGVH